MAHPETIGPYRVLRELGSGGMGSVYEVERPGDPRRLALKLITSALDPDTLTRFAREAEAMARVAHPNVIRIHSFERPAGQRPYLVVEKIEGETLSQVCCRGPLEPARAATIVRDIAGAVGALHDAGVLHRDLKPENVMMRADGSPVLLDFGLARLADARSLTATGAVLGTPAYMAPEQAQGDKHHAPLSERTDVYGLGATLYYLLTGRPPFRGSAISVLLAVSETEPDWTDLAGDQHLQRIVQRAMAKRPDDRYPSTAALAAALQAWLDDEPPPRRPLSRGRIAATSALALSALIGLVALSNRSPGPDPAETPPSTPPPSTPPPSAPPPTFVRLPGWRQTAPAPVVSGMANAATFDPRRGMVIVYGGFDPAGRRQRSFWGYKAEWRELQGIRQYTNRVNHVMVATRQGIFIHGGETLPFQDPKLMTIGRFDHITPANTWSQPIQFVPSVRAYHAMAHDTERGDLVLFGGQEHKKRQLRDTWTFALHRQAWRREPIDLEGPPPRHQAALATFTDLKQVVLFGGFNGKTVLGDLWAWKGKQWEPIKRRNPWPAARMACALTGLGDRVLLFGGVDGSGTHLNDMWTWDGKRWRELDVPTRPAPRKEHALVFDPLRKVVVLFGGTDASRSFPETWEWRVPAQWPD